jgi:hypothetical protein
MTIIFSTIMLWYSGFLRYHTQLVTTNAETVVTVRMINRFISFCTLFQYLGLT